MTRKRALPLLFLAAVAGTSAVAVVLLSWDSGEGGTRATASGGSPRLEAQASLLPGVALFGDTVRAVVDITLDRNRVDPGSVRVASGFSPWEVVGGPTRARRDAGATTHLRTTYVLRCLSSPCVSGTTTQLKFSAARVTFAGSEDGGIERDSVQAEWPVLLVYSRFSDESFEGGGRSTSPWRADVLSLPPVSYRAAPRLVVGLLLGGSVLLGVVGLALAYLAWPRRAPSLPPEPEPEPRPSLTPLEQALALLEEKVRADGAGEQRRALELVSDELSEWGDDELARSARALAWSEHEPDLDETSALAERVRVELERELLERTKLVQSGDGRVV